METNQDLKEAFIRYLDDKYTSEDFHLIQNYFQKQENATLTALIKAELDKMAPEADERIDRILRKVDVHLERELRKQKKVHVPVYQKLYFKIAASIVIILSIAAIFLQQYRPKTGLEKSTVINVAPGSNKAILTLGNGSKISLTDAMKGIVAHESNIRINKTADGQIIYTASGEKSNKTPLINTIETPRGGQFQVVLPDGTKVWLNAASSLRYPTQFTGKIRSVELIGEGYFQVTHNKTMPFIVKTTAQEVKVLGTVFNINSYPDDVARTTLIEGSVRVSPTYKASAKPDHSIIIKPGQQAVMIADRLTAQQADLETAIAWKNGRLEFKDANIRDIMKQVSRWYNIEIEYRGKVPERVFDGSISRKSNLSALLKILELSNIHFLLEHSSGQNGNKKLIVIP